MNIQIKVSKRKGSSLKKGHALGAIFGESGSQRTTKKRIPNG